MDQRSWQQTNPAPELQGPRQVVDCGHSAVRYRLETMSNSSCSLLALKPQFSFATLMPPQFALKTSPVTGFCTRFTHICLGKAKTAVLSVVWTPDGRRVLTGSMSGELTLWHGMDFSFELLMQAHENAVRTMAYSHSGEWLLSGDEDGMIKVWQPNLNNVHIMPAHQESLRGLSWSPNDSKFVTCSDDSSLKVWSFTTMKQEAALAGHGWDVKCVDWHPSLGLICSGSKDNLVKLWDPRQSKCLFTLHEFKNTVSKTLFQPLGGQRLFAAVSRDHTGRIFDLRTMQSVFVLRGHSSDISAATWHPDHSQLLTTGAHDGSINHYLLDQTLLEGSNGMQPQHVIPKAHTWPVWDLAYHPAGHMLTSTSNDRSIRFWVRARPDDDTAFQERFYTEERAANDGRDEVEKFKQRERERLLAASRVDKIPGIDT